MLMMTRSKLKWGDQDVVITGVGMVTPVGGSTIETWHSLLRGDNGIGPITRFDASNFPVHFAAECAELDILGHQHLSTKSQRILTTRKGRLAFRAAQEAWVMACVDGETSTRWTSSGRLGVCLGSEAGRPKLKDVAYQMRNNHLPSVAELNVLAPRAPADLVAEMIGATGPVTVVSTACTSSSQAIGEGVFRIRRGEVDAMLVGGVDELVDPLMVTGFSLLGALSTRNDSPEKASRPFDKDRDGFVLGEGSGMLLLESVESARSRGAVVLGHLKGFGCSCNAYRITDSPPDGRGAAQSMEDALRDAGLEPKDIGYINAHGTSTPMNDPSESRGIHTAFGDLATQVPVSSTKSMMGHLVAACGAVEAIISLLAVREGHLPMTRNLDEPDPECDLFHIRGSSLRREIEHAMSNAFGFGGSNGTVVVSRWRS
jgi:3-oxoacyl-[acyl-carrier-protein] synthase II